MLALTAVAKQEKNKLTTNSAFVILLDIVLKDDVIRICYNTEDIEWNGHLYQAFPFTLGEVTETTDGSDPNVELAVSNKNRALQSIVEESNGGVGLSVILRVVNTKNLASTKAELIEMYSVKKTKSTEEYISFTLGCEYSSRTRRPLNKFMKNNCPFKYMGIRCGYNGTMPDCDHSLTDCRAHDNSVRFGGFPGIDQKGVYANE